MDNYFDMIIRAGVSESQAKLEYEVAIEFTDFSKNKIVEYIKIDTSVRLCDVLDSIFFILNGRVNAYKYLEEWIVREKGTNRYVVVSDVQNLILAMDVFRIGTEWVIEFLDKPYVPDNTFNSEHNNLKIESFTSYRQNK